MHKLKSGFGSLAVYVVADSPVSLQLRAMPKQPQAPGTSRQPQVPGTSVQVAAMTCGSCQLGSTSPVYTCSDGHRPCCGVCVLPASEHASWTASRLALGLQQQHLLSLVQYVLASVQRVRTSGSTHNSHGSPGLCTVAAHVVCS